MRALFFVLAFFATFVMLGPGTSALSVVFCEENTIECKVQNCHTSNAVLEFDRSSTPRSDCEAYEQELRENQVSDSYLLIIGVAFVSIAGAFVGYRLIRRENS